MTDVETHLVPVVLEEKCTKQLPPGLTPVPRLEAGLGFSPRSNCLAAAGWWGRRR